MLSSENSAYVYDNECYFFRVWIFLYSVHSNFRSPVENTSTVGDLGWLDMGEVCDQSIWGGSEYPSAATKNSKAIQPATFDIGIVGLRLVPTENKTEPRPAHAESSMDVQLASVEISDDQQLCAAEPYSTQPRQPLTEPISMSPSL